MVTALGSCVKWPYHKSGGWYMVELCVFEFICPLLEVCGVSAIAKVKCSDLYYSPRWLFFRWADFGDSLEHLE